MSSVARQLASVLALLLLLPVGAQQVVEERDGVVVRVAAYETNLIEAKDGQITRFVFTEGMFTETIDDEAGVVYFRPLAEGPVSGFVEMLDSLGVRQRFNLILVPDPQRSSQRVILKADTLAVAPNTPLAQAPSGSELRVKVIKRLLRRMMSVSTDVQMQTVPATEQVFGELALIKLAELVDAGLVGELHRLENRGDENRQFDEARLHVADDIVAVALRAVSLEPGTATEAYLVRVNRHGLVRP